MLKHVLAAATILAFQALSLPASATPFVDIRATWGAGPSLWSPLEDGLSLSCRGDAVAIDGGCSNTLFLRQPVTASGTYSATSTGHVVITNTSDHAISGGATLDVWFSAFNPGGPSIGIGIDDAATQSGYFSSSVALSTASVLDSHGCGIGTGGEYGAVFSPTTCGVGAPDSSETVTGASFIDLLPGAEFIFTFALDITATFDLGEDEPAGVPEPASVLLALGLAALLARRRYLR
jgi:hypothetical protein